MKATESAPVRLARRTLEHYLSDGRLPAQLPEAEAPTLVGRRAGVFVSLKKGGALRGCIGTFLPTEPDLAHEIIANAIQAATGDPRFYPVQREELDTPAISVDVLSAPEPVAEASALDPKRYGVIMTSGQRRSLLLPDLPGVDTVAAQLAILRQKANIPPDAAVTLMRFTVTRYE